MCYPWRSRCHDLDRSFGRYVSPPPNLSGAGFLGDDHEVRLWISVLLDLTLGLAEAPQRGIQLHLLKGIQGPLLIELFELRRVQGQELIALRMRVRQPVGGGRSLVRVDVLSRSRRVSPRQ